MIDFDHARKTMVDNQLRTSNVTDRRLLAAMGEVPREKFVPGPRHALAYIDEAHPLIGTRKLAAPAPFAKLVQLAAIAHTDRVLDLGCGTGYSAAVLAHLAHEVVAVEDDATLVSAARTNLSSLGIANVTVVEGALMTAGKGGAPFDVIVVEGALEQVPEELLAQLKPEGKLVAPIAPKGRPGVAHLFVRSGKGVAAYPEFDAGLPLLVPRRDDAFVF